MKLLESFPVSRAVCVCTPAERACCLPSFGVHPPVCMAVYVESLMWCCVARFLQAGGCSDADAAAASNDSAGDKSREPARPSLLLSIQMPADTRSTCRSLPAGGSLFGFDGRRACLPGLAPADAGLHALPSDGADADASAAAGTHTLALTGVAQSRVSTFGGVPPVPRTTRPATLGSSSWGLDVGGVATNPV